MQTKLIKKTNNLLLRWYSNICGSISHFFLMQYLKWGDVFEITDLDLEEDIDKEDD